MDTPIYTRGRARQSLIDTVTLRVVSQIATVLGYVILVRGMQEWEFGIYSLLYDAGVFLLYSTMDNFFIAAYLDPLSVGIYSFYSRLRQMVLNALPAKLFENVIQPLFFSIASDQAQRRIPPFLLTSCSSASSLRDTTS